ncbi:hypothetical protein GQ600_12048 [Phytophthora cactorum]|nr:hypothetical protein GQ600_12048 [Phytophthora cactorum]
MLWVHFLRSESQSEQVAPFTFRRHRQRTQNAARWPTGLPACGGTDGRRGGPRRFCCYDQRDVLNARSDAWVNTQGVVSCRQRPSVEMDGVSLLVNVDVDKSLRAWRLSQQASSWHWQTPSPACMRTVNSIESIGAPVN